MNWLKKLFGKSREEMIIQYNRGMEDAARMALLRKWEEEQAKIQKELGFTLGDSPQNWLRQHQIMLNHENRIKALEGKK